ncbi:hypothetical protein NC652_037206 [Populus alba x Populus x berolinensis]|nr:hypothetical protein NC652_037206 [Populus alba x Populus x berolinensis]
MMMTKSEYLLPAYWVSLHRTWKSINWMICLNYSQIWHLLLAGCPGTAQYSPSSVVTSQMFPSIIHCLKDALKDEKASPPSFTVHVSIIGPAFAECLKDSSTPVKTMSQKFITGLDARRLSKFAEYR